MPSWTLPGTATTGNVIPASYGNDINGDLTILQDQVGLYGAGTAYSGTVPVTTAPNFLIQAASLVGTTASSLIVVTFPTPFPNGVLTVMTCPGDSTGTCGETVLATSTVTTSGFQVTCNTSAGVGVGTATVRVNWIAIGF